jgi:pyruvate dehydrogenase E2 component (dihydrolipoamide acetyltransferase)
MGEFRMPSLGADMEAGTLVEWRVKPGDRVRRGDIIAVVDTEKAAIEIEAFEDGVVEEILVQPGEKVPVGTVLAIIRPEAAPKRAEEAAPPPETVPMPAMPEGAEGVLRLPGAGQPPPAPPAAVEGERGAVGERIRVSPYARRLAAERSVDLGSLQGTGPGGAIRAADVERAAASAAEKVAPALPPSAPRVPAGDFQAGVRRAIAAAMARSNREIPHYYLHTRIDMSRPLCWLETENARRPIKERLLAAVLLIKAVALALADVPELNGYWVDDRHQPREAINIGFAIALRQGGLIAPAILQADRKSLEELMGSLRDLITRARAGRLRSSEMTEATITVTNLGDLGVEGIYGVIYPPQVALVGFGKIMEQPWAENGMLGIRPVVLATLAADHRATDGRRGAQFLDAVNHHLQDPATL